MNFLKSLYPGPNRQKGESCDSFASRRHDTRVDSWVPCPSSDKISAMMTAGGRHLAVRTISSHAPMTGSGPCGESSFLRSILTQRRENSWSRVDNRGIPMKTRSTCPGLVAVRRYFGAVAVKLLGLAICLCSLSAAPAAFAQQMLSLTLSHLPILPYTNAIVAAQAGFFARAGLDVKRKVLPSTDMLRAALASGEVDVVAVSTDIVARAHASGFDWQLLYPADIYESSRADAILVGKPDLVFNSAKDLEGKTVAATIGTIAELSVRGWMVDNGGDVSKLKTVDIPYPQTIAAFQSGNIDAAHIIEPFMTMAIEKGVAKLIAKHLDAISTRFLISGYVARKSWIVANPEKARRFVEAMEAATQHVNQNPDSVIPILVKETRIPIDLLRKMFPIHYVITTRIRPEEIQSVFDFLARHKHVARVYNYKEIVADYFPLSR